MLINQIQKYKNLMFKYSFLLLILLSLAFSQKTLQLYQTTKITLKGSTPQTYALAPPKENMKNDEDLIIFAEPVVLAPSQMPILNIILENGTDLPCSVDSDELEGLCRLSSSVLSSSPTLKVECKEDCQFWLTYYLNDVISLSLDKQYKIQHKTDTPVIYQFDFQVPKKDFDELTLTLRFLKDSQNQEAQMFANVGNSGALQPDEQNHQYEAVPIYHGIALDLSKEEIPSGTWVKLSILTDKKVKMELSAAMRKAQTYWISMGQDRRGLIPAGTARYFNISMQEYFSQIANYDVSVSILLYSGYPQIYTSFDPTFAQSLQNQGVGGNLVYLLTPELRQKNNFTGIVYVKLQAFNEEVSFRIYSTTAYQNYMFMGEGQNYLSAVQPQQLKNYLYEFKYETSVDTPETQLLYFAAKIHMIHGAIHFFSRICNKPDKECLVTPNNLTDPDFLEEVRKLPGQMLRYYNNYEIYQWTPLSSCKKQINKITNSNNTTDTNNTGTVTYTCKLHTVGYNYAKEECRWVIAMYSRQRNIQLRQGQSFKDKVYESQYNYYSFTPPKSAYNSITVFLTILTGQASIITSLKFLRPQFIFYEKDKTLKASSRNTIIYQLSELQNRTINIGVYGDSMAEYMVHVVVNKNSSSSAIAIPPRLGQLFTMKTASMQFRLAPDSDGPWKVDVGPINGKIKYSVQQIHKEDIVCKESSSSQCELQIKGNTEYILNVGRLSDKDTQQIKFMASYYPKQKCRILPIGTPNFISIPKGANECMEYIIDNREVIVAYSRNILASLTRRVSLNISINGQVLPTTSMHYQNIQKSQIQSICSRNKEDHSQDPQCILKVEVKGSDEGPVDMWMTAALVEAGIPLYQGVELFIANDDMLTADPLRFYYQVTDQDDLYLEVQSKTYDEYAVELLWVDEEKYLNADSDQQVYPGLGKGSTSYSIDQHHRRVSAKVVPSKQCANCILLVSVYAKTNVTKCELQLQIVGSFVSLGLGETIKDTLALEQTITISLPKVDSVTMLTLVNYDSAACYKAYFVNIQQEGSQTQISSNQLTIQANQIGQIQLIGTSEKLCKFQVNRWQSDSPIRQMQSMLSYNVQIYNKSIVYFLYYHSPNSTFRIYQVISSGALYTYATPLDTMTLQKALALDNKQYMFGSDSPYEDLEVKVGQKGFCFKCYYLIKLEGAPGALLDVGVTDMYTPVLMWDDGVVREKLPASTKRYYEHFSITPFNVKVTVISGTLKVTIKNYLKQVIYDETIKKDTTIPILNPDNSFTFYDIIIESQVSSVYAMQIASKEGIRIIEGYAFTHEFKVNQISSFFYSHSSSQSIRLIVFMESNADSEITFNGSQVVTMKDGTKDSKQIQVERQKSGNMVIFTFNGTIADYIFIIKASGNLTAKILVTRNKLTYLPAAISMYAFGNFIFEINTHKQRVMVEVFPCKGDVSLQASQSYSDIQKTNSTSGSDQWSQPVVLEHNNIAGHYVVNSHTETPEYYTKVSGQSYRISYNYIEDMIPYRWFSQVSTTMHYLLESQGIMLEFDLPLPLGGSPDFTSIAARYHIIYGNNIDDVNSYSQCLTASPVISIEEVVADYPQVSKKYSKYISNDQIMESLEKKLNPLYFGVNLKLQYRYNQVVQQISYIYEPLQIDVKQIQVSDGSSFNWLLDFFLMVILLAIIVGVLYFAGRFCWRNWINFKEARQGYRLAQEESYQSSINQMKDKPEQASIQT